MAIWAAGAAIVGTGISVFASSKNAAAARDAQANAAGQLSTELQPFNFIGPGGQFAGLGTSDISGGGFVQSPSNFDFQNLLQGGQQQAPQQQSGVAQPTGQGGGFRPTPGGGVRQQIPGGSTGGGGGGTAAERLANRGFREQSQIQQFGLGGQVSSSGNGEGLENRTGSTIFTGLGDLEPARGGLVGFATNQIGRAGLGGGLPQNVQDANARNQATLGQQVDGDFGTLGALEQGVGSQFGNAQQDIAGARSGFQQGLQDSAFAGATNLAGIAGQDPQQVAQQRLDLLRQQAQPFEDRQVSQNNDNLFATGRLGTTGGSLQTEALGRGLGQADLSRQLSASAEGRAFQNNALQGAQGLAGVGNQTRGLQDNLLNSAFGRFGQTANLGQNLSNTRFQRGAGLQQIQDQRNQQNFQNQLGVSGLGQQLQQGDLNLGLQALQGQSGLNNQALNNFQATLSQSTAQANARIGAGSNISRLAASDNFGQGSTIGSTVGAAIANNSGAIGGALGNIFGGGGGSNAGPDLSTLGGIAPNLPQGS